MISSKKLWMAAAVLLLAGLTAGTARATTLTGTVNNPDGSPFNGVIYFALSNSTTISSANGCPGPLYVPNTYKVAIQVVNGALQGSVNLYDSECMNPAGLAYNVTLVSQTGVGQKKEAHPADASSIPEPASNGHVTQLSTGRTA